MSWAEKQNVKHMIGTDRDIRFGPVQDEVTGDWSDLDGASASWRMARSATAADTLIRKVSPPVSSEGGVTIVPEDWYGALRYYLVVTLVPTDTIGLPPCQPPNKYFHELVITDKFGKIAPLATGDFELTPSINSLT